MYDRALRAVALKPALSDILVYWLRAIVTWGSFMTWNIIIIFIPHWALFTCFLIAAPYYQSPIKIAKLKGRSTCRKCIGTYHPATMCGFNCLTLSIHIYVVHFA